MECARRLAALFPEPRSHRASHARAGQAGRRELFHHEQSNRRLLHPDQEGRANAGSGGSRHRQARRWLRRPPDQSDCKRDLGRLASGHRGPLAAARADRRNAAGVPPQENPERVGPSAHDSPLRRRRKLEGLHRGRRLPSRVDDPRHQGPDPSANSGPARQELRPPRHRHEHAQDARHGRRPGLGQVTFTIETKREHLAAGLDMLRQVLREPSLPYREFEVMKNEQIAGIEQGRSDPIRQGLNQIQRILSPYPSDDVRYVPTLDEQIERLKKILARAGLCALSRLPWGRPRRDRDHRRLRAFRGPADPRQDARGMESRETLRSDRTAFPGEHRSRGARPSRRPTKKTPPTWQASASR